MTTWTFKFIYHIASFQMCLLVLVLKMISNHMCFMNERQGWRSWFCFWRLLCHTVISCITESFGFELLALPSVALFFDWRWIKNNPKRLKIKMYSFWKAFLVLMKLLSLSQFYAPKQTLIFRFEYWMIRIHRIWYSIVCIPTEGVKCESQQYISMENLSENQITSRI